MTRPLNDQGVSVIIGTLLLILITVTAAAALGLMVSQMQKDAMNRQSHINAVNSENVQLVSVGFSNNVTFWSQPPYNISNSGNWSSVTLNLLNLNTDDVKIIGIAVNDQYAHNFTTLSDTPSQSPVPYNVSNQDTLLSLGRRVRKYGSILPMTSPLPGISAPMTKSKSRS